MRESEYGRVSLSVLNQTDDPDRQVRIWLLSSKEDNGITYYRIAGRFTSTGQTWDVYRRYSEFLVLRDTLVKYFTRSTNTCPGCMNYLHSIVQFAFPKKHYFVSKSKLVVNYRIKALRAFMNLLASWSFSNSPKCPTCGGFAFEIFRNFILDGADAVGDSSMPYIRDSLVIDTFTNPERRSSMLGDVYRRSSMSVNTRSARNLTSGQNQVHKPLQRRQTTGSLLQNEQLEYRMSTDNQFRSSSSKTSATPLRRVASNESRPSGVRSNPINSREYGYNDTKRKESVSTRKSQLQRYIMDDDYSDHGSSTSSSSLEATSTRHNEPIIIRADREENNSYVSLAGSNTSVGPVDPDDYLASVREYAREKHHTKVASAPRIKTQKSVYQSNKTISDSMSSGFSNDSYQRHQSSVSSVSDGKIDGTNVTLPHSHNPRKSMSAEGLWQPWELVATK